MAIVSVDREDRIRERLFEFLLPAGSLGWMDGWMDGLLGVDK